MGKVPARAGDWVSAIPQIRNQLQNLMKGNIPVEQATALAGAKEEVPEGHIEEGLDGGIMIDISSCTPIA